MVHGFGSAAAMWYKVIKKLCEKFSVYLIDLIGMGGSSRPLDYDWENVTAQESVDYMAGYIEKWRIAMGNLTDFYLVGHSLGAYTSGNFATKHQQHIKRLMLCSPPGILSPNGEKKDLT